MGLPENFSAKAEEITMSCSQEGIAFKTCSDAGDEDSGEFVSVVEVVCCKRCNQELSTKSKIRFIYTFHRSGKKLGSTVVPMSRSVMESYTLQDEVEMTFAMKEFKVSLFHSRVKDNAHYNIILNDFGRISRVCHPFRLSSRSRWLCGCLWRHTLTRASGTMNRSVAFCNVFGLYFLTSLAIVICRPFQVRVVNENVMTAVSIAGLTLECVRIYLNCSEYSTVIPIFVLRRLRLQRLSTAVISGNG